ncbi:MAG: hypothetical protein KGZ87_05285 [Bacteroidetes bacterium]|nr:hypothetical protein [Bacteroidota bacterium]
MAKQKGIILLKGTIGGITFYKTQDGHLAREKGGVDAQRIKNDPAFQRTRENGAEFGRAGQAGKVLRTAFRALALNAADSRMASRLTQRMMQVIKADSVSDRGQRNVLDGETELLSGFEFNIQGKLGNTLYAPFSPSIDRAAGTIGVEFAAFNPLTMLAAPEGTTHFKIVSGGAEVDFEAGTYVIETSATELLPWSAAPTEVISQSNAVTAESTKPLFLVVGVEFYQQVNGGMYPLKNGAYNALAIAQVSGM